MVNKKRLNKTTFLSFLITFVILFSCNNTSTDIQSPIVPEKQSLETILERGKLIAVTDLNSTSYFVYRGEPRGYQFDLLHSFAEYLGVDLEIQVNTNPEETIKELNAGTYDLIAKRLVITNQRRDMVAFSEPMLQTRLMLVQRKPENWRKMRTWDEVEKKLIRNPLDLEGKTVYIQNNSAYAERLANLQEETGVKINVVSVNDLSTEDLITMVARGEIEYTISDEQTSSVNAKYYNDIDTQTPLGFFQNIGWALKRGDTDLLEALNKWWFEFSKTSYAVLLYDRYFNNPLGLRADQREFHSRKGGRISSYDEVIKKYSKSINWDWRLLASLIYQESKFQHEIVSHKGAFGIMQMMPSTAEELGIDSTSTAYEQIAAGVHYIKWLDKQMPSEISDPAERQKFVLAAYNAGLAHVFDARRLAAKNNKDPNIWDGNVDFYLRNKSKPEYYSDEVVQYGYCYGEESYRFVNDILSRFNHYKAAIQN
ncbi:MAG TPA: transporter substrate-binding domain-containing protein [Bacteroidales bacterium]|nr:transporter substrate-binding domain-containing protein [Bacteroidales bacterium]